MIEFKNITRKYTKIEFHIAYFQKLPLNSQPCQHFVYLQLGQF